MPQIVTFSTRQTAQLGQVISTKMPKVISRLSEQRNEYWTMESGEVIVDTFGNGNIQTRIKTNVRNARTVIFATQTEDVHESLFELFLMISALVGAKAHNVSVVFPCLPYARSDRRTESRMSVGALVVAQILNSLGVSNVLIAEPHDPHISNNFNPLADTVSLSLLMGKYIEQQIISGDDRSNYVMAAPDIGAMNRYRKIPSYLGINSAVINKYREGHDDQPEVLEVIGNVEDKHVIMLDDEYQSGGTGLKGAQLLLDSGAKSVSVLACHGVLSKVDKNGLMLPATEVIQVMDESPVVRFAFTNSVPIDHKVALSKTGKIDIVDATELLAEATARMVVGDSISPLHKWEYYS